MVTKQKILIVDDDNNIAELISLYLTKECFETRIVNDGEQALKEFNTFHPDLILLDLMLPGIDGYQVCREIRHNSDVPIIMLSARGEEYDKLFGFETGIDDYVVKPFSPRELMARVRAVLARSHAAQKNGADAPQQRLKFGGLEIDLAGREVYVDGVRASMTPKEYDLLFYLVKNKGLALSRDKLLEEVWGYDFFGDDRTVDTHIKMLRGSLGPYRTDIVTLRGMGYKFDPENDASSASPAR